MNEQKKEDQKLFEVTLEKPHKHAGDQYAKGDRIKVHEADRAWLAANNVITAPTAAPKEGVK